MDGTLGFAQSVGPRTKYCSAAKLPLVNFRCQPKAGTRWPTAGLQRVSATSFALDLRRRNLVWHLQLEFNQGLLEGIAGLHGADHMVEIAVVKGC